MSGGRCVQTSTSPATSGESSDSGCEPIGSAAGPVVGSTNCHRVARRPRHRRRRASFPAGEAPDPQRNVGWARILDGVYRSDPGTKRIVHRELCGAGGCRYREEWHTGRPGPAVDSQPDNDLIAGWLVAALLLIAFHELGQTAIDGGVTYAQLGITWQAFASP